MKEKHFLLLTGKETTATGIDTFDENLGLPGRWVDDTLWPSFEEGGHVAFDHVTYLLEVLHVSLQQNLHLAWNLEKTERCIQAHKAMHPGIPWQAIEKILPLSTLIDLIAFFCQSGGDGRKMLSFFEIIADAITLTSEPYFIRKQLLEALVSRQAIKELLQQEDILTFCLTPAQEEKVLRFIDDDYDFPLFNLSQISREIGENLRKIEELGKMPVLICNSDIRPLLEEYIGPRAPGLMIFSDSDIDFEITPYMLEEQEVGKEKSSELPFFYSTGNFPRGRNGLSLASLIKDERRYFISLREAASRNEMTIQNTLLFFQDMGFKLEGVYTLTHQEEESPVQPHGEFGRSHIITVQLGKELIQELNRDQEFKNMVLFLRNTLEREFGILPPEISFHYGPSLEPMEYNIKIGLTRSENEVVLADLLYQPSIPQNNAESKVTDHLLNHLLAFIEHNLKELVTYDFVESYRQKALNKLSVHMSSGQQLPARLIKEVLQILLEERVPVKNNQLILQKITREREKHPDEIAENLRFDLRDEITGNLINRYGRVIAINLARDFELVLSSPLFNDNLSSPANPGEREYIAQLIAHEYLASDSKGNRLPLACSKALRKTFQHLLSPLLPEVLIIAREEIAGQDIYYEGTINMPPGFSKFIFDEILKQGILSDYEEEEEKTLLGINQIKRQKSEERRKSAKKKKKEELFIKITVSSSLGAYLQGTMIWQEFNSFILFLREWMKQATGREVPQVVVDTDSERRGHSFMLHHPGFEEVCVELPQAGPINILPPHRAGKKVVLPVIKNLCRPKSHKDTLELAPEELLLLYLFTAMNNLSTRREVTEKEWITRLTMGYGEQAEDYQKVCYKLLEQGAHPLVLKEKLAGAAKDLAFMGAEATEDYLFKHCTDFIISYLYRSDKKLHVVALSEEIEAYLKGYDIPSDILPTSPPPSLQRLAALIIEELKGLIKKGLPPVLITTQLQEAFLYKLIEHYIPHIQIFRKRNLPSDAELVIISRLDSDITELFSSRDAEAEESLLFTVSTADFYLFCALLSDNKGWYTQSATLYGRLLELFPYHPTALWRGAFCEQRKGTFDRARQQRARALHFNKKMALLEPHYYKPEAERAEWEFELHKTRLAQDSTDSSAELRLGLCANSLGEDRKAQRSLKKSLKQEKHDDDLYTALAGLSYEREDFRKAARLYQEALKLNPWNREAQKGLALILSEESQHYRAWQSSRALLQEGPLEPELLMQFGQMCEDLDDPSTEIRVADLLIKYDRSNSLAYFMRSRACHRQGNLEQELQDLRKALKLEPDNALFNRTMGEILWAAELYEEARIHIYKVFERGRDNTHATFHRAKTLMKLGDYITAGKIIKEGLKKGDASLHHLMGENHIKLGNLQEGKKAFNKSFQINPLSSIYELSVAEALRLEGEKQRAEKIYRKIVKQHPDWVVVYPGLAQLTAEGGKSRSALQQLFKAIGYTPAYLELYITYFSLYRDDIKPWQEYLEERLNLHPLNHSFHFCKGLLAAISGEHEKSLGEFERAYLLTPETPLVVEYLCRALMAQQDAQKAIVVLRVALKRILRSSRLYFLEGICWRALGKTSRALESFTRAANIDPLYPYACIARGNFLLLEGKLDEAEKEAYNALKYYGFFGPALLLLAELHNKDSEQLKEKAQEFSALEILGIHGK